jgi:hypothetical protein
MILEFALSVSLSFDNNLKRDQLNNYNSYTSQITMDSVERYQFTTKDINLDPYSYIKQQNSDILYKEISKELLQDEEDKK